MVSISHDLSAFPTYTQSDNSLINPGEDLQVTANCNSGDKVLSGAYSVGSTVNVRISQPFGNGWEVWGTNDSGGVTTTLTVTVICLNLE